MVSSFDNAVFGVGALYTADVALNRALGNEAWPL